MATATPPPKKRRFPIWAIVLITMLLSIVVTLVIVRHYFFPKPFDQVALSVKEQKTLDQKLALVLPHSSTSSNKLNSDTATLEPEAYSEKNALRDIKFSEREVNALIANNTDLADKLAVDLGNDLVSAKLLVPLDPDFPIMGGKTVRINAGMQLNYIDGRPVAVLKGVSVMGVPLPNAWLGNLKNIDLVQEFGDQQGFWSSFAAGINALKIENGELKLSLNE